VLRTDLVFGPLDLISSVRLRSRTSSVLKDLILAIRIRSDGRKEEEEGLPAAARFPARCGSGLHVHVDTKLLGED
jgi:hypothetical protein